MKEVWKRIENWLRENHPETLDDLCEGASEDLINEVEKSLNIEFPADVRESYKIHNGTSLYLFNGWVLHSLAGIVDEWQIWKQFLDEGVFDDIDSEPQKGIRNVWFDEKWIPLTNDGSTNHHCIDLNPLPEGEIGQIIRIWKQDDERELIADSFREWMTTFADELETGIYKYSADFGFLKE
jgi:cell wall assembly regulator SMI1